MGRKSKLNPELQAKICRAIAAGSFFSEACEYAGIGRSTGYDWLARGESRSDRTSNKEYVIFADTVRSAEARGEIALISRINKESEEDWRAAAWLLERRYSERWANSHRIQLQVKKELEQTLDQLELRLPTDVFAVVLRALIQISDEAEL